MDSTTKVCVGCRKRLPHSEFYARAAAKDGRQHLCKSCSRTDSSWRHKQRASTRVVIMDGEKTCAQCGLTKPVQDFSICRTATGGRYSYCKSCSTARARAYRATSDRYKENRRWYDLERDLGVSRAQYEAMHEAQDGACAICGSIDLTKRLSVDHDHETGQLRGLLCIGCNRAIGFFGEDVERMKRGIGYLEKWAAIASSMS